MLLRTLSASFLANLLTGQGIARADSGNNKQKRNCKSWFQSSFVFCFAKTIGFLIPPYPLTNFEIALFCNRNEIVYFDSFGVEHIPEEIKEFIGNKDIKANIYRVQENDSIMCGWIVLDLLILCWHVKH